jgi:Zn-dependent protease
MWALVLKAALPGALLESVHLVLMAKIGISVNLVLMALNLLPVPPLDGGRIAVSLLPMRAARVWARIEPYGLFVIVALLAFGLLDNVMAPLLRLGQWLLQTLLGS